MICPISYPLKLVEPRIRPRPHLVDVENLSEVIAEVFHDVIHGLKR